MPMQGGALLPIDAWSYDPESNAVNVILGPDTPAEDIHITFTGWIHITFTGWKRP